MKKLSWMVLMCAAWCCCYAIAQQTKDDGNAVSIEAKGKSQNAAIGECWRTAMMQHIKIRFVGEDVERHKKDLEKFINNNWKNFVKGDFAKPKILKPYSPQAQTITILATIDGEKLCQEVSKQFPKIGKAQTTAKTEKLATDDDDEEEDEEESRPARGYLDLRGQGKTKDEAIEDACKQGLWQYVKANMEIDARQRLEGHIRQMLEDDWESYIQGDPLEAKVVKPFSAEKGFITIRVRIKGDELLSAIMQIHGNLEKLAKITVMIKAGSSVSKDERLDFDVVRDEVMRVLQKNNVSCIDPKAANPDLDTLVVITLEVSTDMAMQDNARAFLARIRSEGLYQQRGVSLWNFQFVSGSEWEGKKLPAGVKVEGMSPRDARAQATKELASCVGNEIVKSLTRQRQIGDRSGLTLKFQGFTAAEFDNIETAIRDMSEGSRPSCKLVNMIKPDSKTMEVDIRWKRTADSQIKIEKAIRETLASNGVKAMVTRSKPGIIVFEPQKEEK